MSFLNIIGFPLMAECYFGSELVPLELEFAVQYLLAILDFLVKKMVRRPVRPFTAQQLLSFYILDTSCCIV